MDWFEYLRLEKLNLLTEEKINELFCKCASCGACKEYKYIKYCEECLSLLSSKKDKL